MVLAELGHSQIQSRPLAIVNWVPSIHTGFRVIWILKPRYRFRSAILTAIKLAPDNNSNAKTMRTKK
jgi:hypothetical protein